MAPKTVRQRLKFSFAIVPSDVQLDVLETQVKRTVQLSAYLVVSKKCWIGLTCLNVQGVYTKGLTKKALVARFHTI